MSVAFVFPGQGSQKVGMAGALADAYPAARAVFEEVDGALNQKLFALIEDGPEDELTLTENAQPALMAVSMAALAALRSEGGDTATDAAAFVAGHSLGEYSALCAAGALSIGDAARLLKRRGQAMQQAVPVGAGGMAAVLGLDLDAVRAIAADAAEGEVCAAANDNAPGQVVISGAKAAVQRASALAKERGAKRAVDLPVSAPFHCSLMAPAAEVMAQALAEVDLRAPQPPLVANVTAAAVDDADEVRRLLVAQVTGTVRWRESMIWLADNGVTALYEIGAGNVLSGLARRIDGRLQATPVGTPDAVVAAAAALAGA